MYIWIGCKLPTAFEQALRAHCLRFNEDIGLDTSGFSLPQHISLKISFDASDKADAVIDYLSNLLQAEAPFYVNLSEVEQQGNIIWIPVAENHRLQALHEMLDEKLERLYGVPQHAFDKDFRFHSTLFLGQDTAKLQRMCGLLKSILPERGLRIDTILIGTSPSGKSGSYHVVREVPLLGK